MQINKDFYIKLGFSSKKAEELNNLLPEYLAKDLAFYVKLGYSLIESEYLTLNVFNTVKSVEAPAKLGVPVGFSGAQSFVGQTNLRSIGTHALDETFINSATCITDEVEYGACLVAEEEDDEETDVLFEECSAATPIVNQVAPEFNESNIFADSEEIYYPVRDQSTFKDVVTSPTSTIRATVNTASFGYIKENILKGNMIHTDAIRSEEIINYLNYKFDKQLDAELISYKDSNYMLVGITGKQIENIKKNIVILLDTSGSMASSDTELQKSLMTIVKQLGPEDKISLITYASQDKIIFESIPGNSTSDIILSLSKISIAGCTAGSVGLDEAYRIAKDNFIEDGCNRVIILTDGDFNFGTYNTSELKQFIKDKKKTGVFLTVLGVSRNRVYQEQIMETLAREGNGNYFRVYDNFDIIESCKNNFLSNSIAVAKDVKIQVEFNPAKVAKYKLIGYETRNISHNDFTNDNVESETIGNNQVVVALYELVLADECKLEQKLKYQRLDTTGSEDICTIQYNYKGIRVDDTESHTDSLEVKEFGDKSQNIYKALICKYFVDFIKTKSIEEYAELQKLLERVGTEDSKINMIAKLAKTFNKQL